MEIKKKLRKILEEIRYQSERVLGCIYWIHIGDLLTPCEGNITAGQYFVTSRVLDIETMRTGGTPKWQNLLTDKILGNTRTEKEKIKADKNFQLLVESLESRGLNPNIAKCSISDNPVVLNNGTHRVGWCVLYAPNMYVPCIRNRNDLKPWFPIEGKGYFEKYLDRDQLHILENRFNKILEEGEVRSELTAYIECGKADIMEKVINEYGKMIDNCEIIVDGCILKCFRFRLNKQFLFTEKNMIYSKYVREMERRLNGDGIIAHTVTKSIEIENWLEEKSGEQLFSNN